MATNVGLKFVLNSKLYDLKKIKKRNPGVEIAELDDTILATEAVMDEEDIALVEKKIAQLS